MSTTKPFNPNPFRGVTWHKRDRRWRALLRYGNKHINLGAYRDPVVAAKVWDWAARFLRGKCITVNFDGNAPAEVPEFEIKMKLLDGGVPEQRVYKDAVSAT